MALREQIQKISTNWREILLKILDDCPTLEETYHLNNEKYKKELPTYPELHNIFRCFNYFNVEETKVVILGQDPYHGPGQAIGLSFGVNDDFSEPEPEPEPFPPSLKNIFKKIENPRTTKSLEWWAKQGVLMLNASLTVRHKTPASYMKMWRPFTKKVIEILNNSLKSTIFVAWGAFAHNLLKDVDKRHHLLVSSHPSPLSYSRKYKEFPAFKDSQPFKDINMRLIHPIIW